jgi:uncharacterized protein (TIGR03382 family)
MNAHRWWVTVARRDGRGGLLGLVLLSALPTLAAHAQSTGFPVVTHYPAAGGTTADTTRRLVPAYEVYSASVTDEYAPSQTEFNTAGQLVFQAAGVRARFLNDPAALTEGAAEVQIVSNWPIGAALYTVAVPAGWRRNGSYPIFLSGNPTTYSNNYRVFSAQEASVLGFVVRRGFIGAYSNAGGIESQGVSERVLRSVGQALDTFATLGGDKRRVVTAGFSRGAQTAFVWAANPLGLDYTVLAAFGHALPASAVEAVTAPYATYPWLGWLSDVVTGDAELSRYDHVPPPHSFPNRVLEILSGQGTSEGNSTLAVLERLRGKQLVFSAATHDAVVPYRTGVAFTRALDEAGIPHMAVLVQNTGHTWANELVAELARAIEELGAGRAYVAPAGRIYASQSELRTHDYQRQVRVTSTTMPFSAVLPFRAARGQPMRVDLCGAPGAQYVVCAVLDGLAAQSTIYLTGEIPSAECVSHSVAAPLTLGNYTWNIILNGRPIPRTQTPIQDLRPALQVDAIQPGHFEAMPGQLPVQMGISALSPQLGESGVACPPPAVGPGTDAGSPEVDSGFQIVGDSGPRLDTGPAAVVDAGPADTGNPKPLDSGCGCTSTRGSSGDLLAFVVVLAALSRRRKR